MASVVEGLKKIDESLEEEEAKFGNKGPKIEYFAPKQRLYINVGVDTDNGIVTKVMSQSLSTKAVIGPAILEQARELGAITDRWFKVKRTGVGQYDTTYTFTPLKEHGLNPEDYEVYNIKSDVLKAPAYADQAEFYNKWRNYVKDAEQSGLGEFDKKTTSNPSKDNEEW